MNQKEQLVSLLNENQTMTQGELAEAIYSSLMSLVKSGIVNRTGSNIICKYYEKVT